MYKESIYNYFFMHNNNEYIYNTYSGALALVDKTDIDTNHKFIRKDIQKYIDLGFLVPNDCAEEEIVLLSRTKGILDGRLSVFRIMPTTSCNAKCFYCYEDGIEPLTMDMPTATEVIKFIKKFALSKEKITIQWFGGEPLLCKNIISYITNELLQDNPSKCIYRFNMVTNGILFDSETIKMCKLWNLDRIQITIDGLKQEYETRKQYANIENAFEKIIYNIHSLLREDQKIIVRINYDGNNLNNILKLIDYLGNEFGNEKTFSCYAYPLFGTLNSNASNKITNENLIEVMDRIVKMKIGNYPSLSYRKTTCFACWESSFVINPIGKLFKCSTCLDHSIGNVGDGFNLSEEYFKWCDVSIKNECRKCIFLPLCQAGCQAGQLGYHPTKCFIEKDIIKDILIHKYCLD